MGFARIGGKPRVANNKCSMTEDAPPLFDRLSLGFGNEEEKGPEGYVDGNVPLVGQHGQGLGQLPPLEEKDASDEKVHKIRILHQDGRPAPPQGGAEGRH